MPFTLLDGVLLVIMLLSGVLAMIRGFVREVLSIGAWVVAAVAAYLLYDDVLPYVQGQISNEHIALAIAAGGVFLVVLLVASFITMRISDYVLDSRIGALDRTLGFAFGAVRGLVLVVVAMLFFNWFVSSNDDQPRWIARPKPSRCSTRSAGGCLPPCPRTRKRRSCGSSRTRSTRTARRRRSSRHHRPKPRAPTTPSPPTRPASSAASTS